MIPSGPCPDGQVVTAIHLNHFIPAVQLPDLRTVVIRQDKPAFDLRQRVMQTVMIFRVKPVRIILFRVIIRRIQIKQCAVPVIISDQALKVQVLYHHHPQPSGRQLQKVDCLPQIFRPASERSAVGAVALFDCQPEPGRLLNIRQPSDVFGSIIK